MYLFESQALKMIFLHLRYPTATEGVLGQLFWICYRRKRVAPHIFLSKSPYYYSSSSVCFCSRELEKLAKNIIRLHWEKVLILSVVIVEFFILTFWEKVFSLLLVDIFGNVIKICLSDFQFVKGENSTSDLAQFQKTYFLSLRKWCVWQN